MDKNQKKLPDGSPSRRKFVWGLGVFSLFAAFGTVTKFPFWSKRVSASRRECKNTTVKMLTQDGRIVEVDATLLASDSRKISNTELQNWIKK